MNGQPHAEAVHTGRKPVPRGLKTTGPVLFSYGFRPFFLSGAVWAILAMLLWILSLTLGTPLGGSYGGVNWHAHEMLFGFASAVMAGFLLTAVPNWTGGLPVSGGPLVFLWGLWLAGRVAFLQPDFAGALFAVTVESLFLPFLLFICAREIVAGRQWKNLKVLAGVTLVMAANIAFHVLVLTDGDVALANRIAVSAYVLLIMVIGGRIVPSFTRNWLNRMGSTRFPVPFNRYDVVCILTGALAAASWIVAPDETVTAVLATLAAGLHAVRLYRWRGWTVSREKLLLILHVAYAFVPLGFVSVALAAIGRLNPYSALHVLTVGAMGLMMLAVMTRATRGHTGRELTASPLTQVAYLSLIAAALLRPLAEVLPNFFHTVLAASALLWMLAFGLFLLEYAPMLTRLRRAPIGG